MVSIDFYVVRPNSPRLSPQSQYLLQEQLSEFGHAQKFIEPTKIVVGVSDHRIVSVGHFTHGLNPKIQFIMVNEDIEENPLIHVNLILKRMQMFIGFRPYVKEKNIWVKHFPDIGNWYFSQLQK